MPIPIMSQSMSIESAYATEVVGVDIPRDTLTYLSDELDYHRGEQRGWLDAIFAFFSGEDDVIDTGHSMGVKYTMLNADLASEYSSLDEIAADERMGEALMGQYEDVVKVYDFGNDDYWAAFVDVTRENNAADGVWQVIFSRWDTTGTVYDFVEYDAERGIAYIPKSFYFNENGEEVARSIQCQVVIPYSLDDDNVVDIAVSVDSEIDGVDPVDPVVVSSDIVEPDITIPVVSAVDADKISLDNISVVSKDDDGEMTLVDGENAFYDNTTGELTLVGAPVSSTSYEIKLSGGIASTNVPVTYADASSMNAWAWGKITNWDELGWYENQYITYDAWTAYFSNPTVNKDPNLPGGSWAGYVQAVLDGNCTYSLDNREGLIERIYNGTKWSDIINDVALYPANKNFINDITFAFSGPGEWNLGVKGLSDPGGAWNDLKLIGTCGHTSIGAGPKYNGGWGNYKAGMRVLKIDEDEGYVIASFISINANTQTGCGVYKFKIDAKGWIEMNKTLMSPEKLEWTRHNKNYSLAGARYGVYTSEACLASDLVTTFTTDANGRGTSEKIKKGTYWVKEIDAPKGYAVNPTPIKTIVESGKGNTVIAEEGVPSTFSDRGQYGFGIEKMDYNRYVDGQGNAPQGAADLVEAAYKVTYYDDYFATPEQCRAATPWKHWKSTVIRTKLVNGRAIASYSRDGIIEHGTKDADGKITWLGIDDEVVLPVGTYLIEEVSPPKGYHLSNAALQQKTGYVLQARRSANQKNVEIHVMNANANGTNGAITKTGGTQLDPTFNNTLVSLDMVKRADVSLNKYMEVTTDIDQYPDGKKPISGVRFEIINNNAEAVLNVETGKWIPGTSTAGCAENDGMSEAELKASRDKRVIYTITTNEDGWASTKTIANIKNLTGESPGRLPIGDYIVREVDGTQPEGYAIIEDTKFSISWDSGKQCAKACCTTAGAWNDHVADANANSGSGGDRNLVFNDKTGTVVCIAKVDAGTGKQVRGETKFQLLDSNHNVMSFDLPYPQSGNLTTLTTDINGIAVLPDKLMPGTYYVREVKAPSGYLWNSQEVPFTCTTETVKEHGQYSDPMRVEFSDNPAMGVIELVKTDSRTGGAITADSVAYDIFAADDIVTEDGTVRAVRDQRVGEITTLSKTGRGTSSNLYLGTYYLVEKKVPTGYLKDEQRHFVTLSYANDKTELATCKVVCDDKPVYGKLGVEKRDRRSGQLIPQEGIEFDVIAAENITGGMLLVRMVPSGSRLARLLIL